MRRKRRYEGIPSLADKLAGEDAYQENDGVYQGHGLYGHR
jgi:hypothetical protein